MREGSLDAPVRHPIPWSDPDYRDEAMLDAELRRVFDICHGCRRCFNLCDSFPRLFDLVDGSDSGELDSVDSADFRPVVDACTLCDMCFMTKCPYVPPHEFALDFPHLMLRYRAIDAGRGRRGFAEKELTKTDRNGRLGTALPGLANWACKCGNGLTRPLMEKLAGVHREAALPRFADSSLMDQAARSAPELNRDAPAAGRRAIIFATCFANYSAPEIGEATRAVLARNGVETEVVYTGCCGMPQFEQGDIPKVAESARTTAAALRRYVDEGRDVIALVSSCALMMKFEWPLILPDDENVAMLGKAVFDVSEYVVDIAGKEGLADGMTALEGGIAVHIACHARAQNMGQKAAALLRLIPGADPEVIERCSGHGGSWGVMKDNFETGMKVGRPVFRKVAASGARHVVSECPLARDHIIQGMERNAKDGGPPVVSSAVHPVQLMARAYGLCGTGGA